MNSKDNLKTDLNAQKRKKGLGVLAVIGIGACCGGYATFLPLIFGIGGLGLVTTGFGLMGTVLLIGAVLLIRRNKNQQRSCEINSSPATQ